MLTRSDGTDQHVQASDLRSRSMADTMAVSPLGDLRRTQAARGVTPAPRFSTPTLTAPLRVTCIVPAFNAGDTVRGIEVARAIREVGQQRGRAVAITFIAPRTTQTFEAQIRQAGFPVRLPDFDLTDAEVAAIMEADHKGTEFLTDRGRAGHMIQALIAELTANRPDLVVFGFLPPVGIAAQLLGVPAVCYVPFPVYRPWVTQHFLKDIPDELDNRLAARLPRRLRLRVARTLSRFVAQTGFFRQPTLAAAGRALGWSPPRPDLFAMLDADIQLVNDMPAYYTGQDIGAHTRITGPLFNRPADALVSPEILGQFEPSALSRVFVCMGSSGEKRYLLAAIKAVAAVACRAVVVVSPRVCPLEEAVQWAEGAPHVLLTDAFVPAHLVNALADVAIIHGGQGTVQTAIFAGTPVIGVGMQWEQSANLDQLVRRGAGMRIARRAWRPDTIAQALRCVLVSPSFRMAARQLKAELEAIDGRQMTGQVIWDLVGRASHG